MQLQQEREGLQNVTRLKEQIDQTRVEIERAQRQQNWEQAARLQYGDLTRLENELRQAEAASRRSHAALRQDQQGPEEQGQDDHRERQREPRHRRKLAAAFLPGPCLRLRSVAQMVRDYCSTSFFQRLIAVSCTSLILLKSGEITRS